MKTKLTLLIILAFNYVAQGQMKIGLPAGMADASAVLDISNRGGISPKGFLGPQVALIANNTASPITDPATGLMVYNTSTAGTPPNDVSPGYYYWNGSLWVLFAISTSTLPITSNDIYGTDGTLSGNRTVGLGGKYLNFTGGNVGIGNSSPTSKLDVAGTGKFSSDVLINGITVGLGGTSAVSNTIFGANAGLLNTTGTNNVFSGYQSGASNSTGAFNIGNGSNTLTVNTTGSLNTAVGYNSLSSNTTGYNNVSIGAGSGALNTIGIGNVFVGNMAGAQETGSNKLYINNANTPTPLLYGNFETSLLGIGLTNPQSTLHSSGTVSSGIPLGGLGGAVATDGIFKLYNLTNANTVSIKGGTTTTSYALTLPPALPLTNQLISSDALGNLSFVDKGAFSWSKLGNTGITDVDNFVGTIENVPLNFRVNNIRSGKIDAINSNTYFGYLAGNSTVGVQNTAIGSNSLKNNTTGSFNFSGGVNALLNNATGTNNVAAGYNSLQGNTTGYLNVGVGSGAGFSNIAGFGNVFLGNLAGYNETGNNNLYIANNASTTPLVYGNFATGLLGIGFTDPQSTLHSSGKISTGLPLGGLGGGSAMNGSIDFYNATNANILTLKTPITTSSYSLTLPTAQSGPNELLQNDGNGNLTWVNRGISTWSNLGNSGLIDGTNFIGTTDNIPLSFRVNNIRAGKIDATSNNTYFGYLAGSATNGVQNTAMGGNSLKSNTTGSFNFAGGVNALLNNSTGTNNVAAGYNSLQGNTTGYLNVAVGSGAGFSNIAGFGNVFLGNQSGYNETGNNNLYIANNASATPLVYGNFAAGLLGIGFTDPQSTVHSSGTISSGIPLGGLGGAAAADGAFKLFNLSNANTVSIQGGITATSYTLTLPPALPTTNQLISTDALGNLSFVDKGAFSWSKVGNTGISDVNNFIGTLENIPLNFRVNNIRAGKIDAATNNTYLGFLAGNGTTGVQNTAIGANSLKNNSTGAYNFSGGVNALLNNSTGANNVAAGYNSLQSNTAGYFNVALGNGAGYTNVAGFGNVFLGNQSGYSETGNNNLYIANNASATPLIYGNFATNKLGVGFTTPQTTLHSSGTVSIGIPLGGLGGVPATDGVLQLFNATNANTVSLKGGITTTPYTLTLPPALPLSSQLISSDASGNLSFVDKGAFSWSKNGNTGITDDNFIGTIEYIPFNIRVNNLKAARIDPASKNTYFGYLSGSATTGTNNTGFGASVLPGNTTGVNNAAYGFNSLNANTTGYNNFAGGASASLTNTTGYNNTVVGANSGQGIVTGFNNTIVGANVTGLLGTLSNNVIIADGLGNQRINVDGSGNVGLGTITPAAALDVTSITSGALLPRMTKAQRTAIVTPPIGSIIYQTDEVPGLRVWNGTNWMRYTEITD